ncbi:hypothetical protein [Intestinirhabdus alba]|jgi:GH15 family glucan-1,4-alpha-glucosidase|uniref:hypothetical protein n=1 Tax=Intestinirhabdus alba TaxID=2899544 RepID=UPI001AE00051|nr:hypothetical protein [Intestinirhabdus alba]
MRSASPLLPPRPAAEKIDERIETSDTAWRDWVSGLSWQGPYGDRVRRSGLALKFLWYAPTTSLPEEDARHAGADPARAGDGGPMLWRYSGAEKEEATFIACAFWRIEVLAVLGERRQASRTMDAILEQLCNRGNVETFNEMFDTQTQSWLSHLSLVCAAHALAEEPPE